METVGGSIKLMLFIYVSAAVISLATAWIIKLIFFAIQIQKKRAAAQQAAHAQSDAAAKRTT